MLIQIIRPNLHADLGPKISVYMYHLNMLCNFNNKQITQLTLAVQIRKFGQIKQTSTHVNRLIQKQEYTYDYAVSISQEITHL